MPPRLNTAQEPAPDAPANAVAPGDGQQPDPAYKCQWPESHVKPPFLLEAASPAALHPPHEAPAQHEALDDADEHEHCDDDEYYENHPSCLLTFYRRLYRTI